LWDLKHQEEDLEQKIESLKGAMEIAENRKQDGGEQELKNISRLKDAAERAAQSAEARLKQKAREVEQQLQHGDQRELRRIELRSAELTGEIDQVVRDSHDFSLEFGQGGRLSAGERLELGRRLAGNRKIGELARMVGRFKQEARALKRKTLECGMVEAYDIERGGELGRLIPAELLAFHHVQLKRDFRRRLLEGQVLQYRLRDDDQKGRGPMVVCIDVSSSMQGDKELWAKAVSLTLMDIARRQRRLFRAVLFSSGDENLKALDLNRKRRYQPELARVLEMAEYFPGGGTDFERPLAKALETIEAARLRRADIVFITDGESQVSPEFMVRLRERKDALQISIFAVLVDIGSSDLSALKQFSDRVTSVRKLTSTEDARDIFIKLQA
ncbi:MAG: vWA domain-containing protein, partial [Candidatus Binataceae bacterium]